MYVLKISFVTLLILLFAFTCYSQQNIDTIYGNPRYVKEKVEFLKKNKQNYTFMVGDGDYGHGTILNPEILKNRFHGFWFEYSDVGYINYEKEFLKNGKPKNETWLDKDEDLVKRYEYVYDESQKLIQEKEFWYDNEYNLINYYYNEKNENIAKTQTYSDNKNGFKHWYYKYDSNGNLLEEMRINQNLERSTKNYSYSKNKIIGKSEHINKKLQDLGNGAKLYRWDSIGTRFKVIDYKYDEKERVILETTYNKETQEEGAKKIYKYDNNNIIERTIYNTPSDTSYYYRALFKYNKLHLKIKEESIFSGRKEKTVTRIYDDDNYIIHITIEEISKTYNIDYKYDFDKKGNWTKIIKIVNDVPLYLWTRNIKYY